MLDAALELQSEPVIRLNSNQLWIKSAEAHGRYVMDFVLRSNDFESYSCPQPIEVAFNVEEAKARLENWPQDGNVSLVKEESASDLSFGLNVLKIVHGKKENTRTKMFKLDQADNGTLQNAWKKNWNTDLPLPTIEIDTLASKLRTIADEHKRSGRIGQFIVCRERLMIVTGEGNDKSEALLNFSGDEQMRATFKENFCDFEAMFDLAFLSRLLSLGKVLGLDSVRVKLGKNSPLVIQFLGSSASIEASMAQWIGQ